MNRRCGLLVNSSRGIIYASSGKDFASHAGSAARQIRDEMDQLLDDHGIGK
jgi:orotidine-5'-phosphate decarboxylase